MYDYFHPCNQSPEPLPILLRQLGFSLTLRRKLKQSPGAILINGRPASWTDLIRPGDAVTVAWPAETTIPPVALPLAVSFEDKHLLVVDKPAGLLVHPTSGPTEPTLANAVVHHLLSRGEPAAFHPVHRLDRNTSGLIAVAKNPLIQHLLSKDGNRLSRSYLAVVNGRPDPPAGVIDAPIGRHPHSIIQRMVRADGQAAATSYKTVAVFGRYTLLRVCLLSGRTHQIRVHLAHIGHPLLGDDLYGGCTRLITRQALHAAELSFLHPATGERLDLISPPPPDIAALLKP